MSSRSVRLLAVALSSLCIGGFAPAAARADGDPASDFLITQDIFVPFDVELPLAETTRLTQLVHDAKTRAYRIKVALIATPYDLGAITPLWRQPQRYAEFLGKELFYLYKGRLLIVMPNGYGIYNHDRPIASERAVLDRLPSPATAGTDVAAAAGTAVRSLARTSGIELALPSTEPRSGSSHIDRIVIGAIAGAAWLLFAAAVLIRHRRRVAARGAHPDE